MKWRTFLKMYRAPHNYGLDDYVSRLPINTVDALIANIMDEVADEEAAAELEESYDAEF